jgi:hypothetical protein
MRSTLAARDRSTHSRARAPTHLTRRVRAHQLRRRAGFPRRPISEANAAVRHRNRLPCRLVASVLLRCSAENGTLYTECMGRPNSVGGLSRRCSMRPAQSFIPRCRSPSHPLTDAWQLPAGSTDPSFQMPLLRRSGGFRGGSDPSSRRARSELWVLLVRVKVPQKSVIDTGK